MNLGMLLNEFIFYGSQQPLAPFGSWLCSARQETALDTRLGLHVEFWKRPDVGSHDELHSPRPVPRLQGQ